MLCQLPADASLLVRTIVDAGYHGKGVGWACFVVRLG